MYSTVAENHMRVCAIMWDFTSSFCSYGMISERFILQYNPPLTFALCVRDSEKKTKCFM